MFWAVSQRSEAARLMVPPPVDARAGFDEAARAGQAGEKLWCETRVGVGETGCAFDDIGAQRPRPLGIRAHVSPPPRAES